MFLNRKGRKTEERKGLILEEQLFFANLCIFAVKASKDKNYFPDLKNPVIALILLAIYQ